MRARFSAERKLSAWPATDPNKSIAFFLSAAAASSSDLGGGLISCERAEMENNKTEAAILMNNDR
jgi:hypothetical protein